MGGIRKFVAWWKKSNSGTITIPLFTITKTTTTKTVTKKELL